MNLNFKNNIGSHTGGKVANCVKVAVKSAETASNRAMTASNSGQKRSIDYVAGEKCTTSAAPLHQIIAPDLYQVRHSSEQQLQILRSNRAAELEDGEVPQPPPTGGWAGLFSEEDSDLNLSFQAPRQADQPKIADVELRDDDHGDISKIWKNTLVGFFVGKRPFFDAVRYALTRAWNSSEEVEFHRLAQEIFMFKFKTFEESQRILEARPWFVKGHLLVLRRWTENQNFQKEEMNSVPIWVKFPNLKLNCRTANVISKISSCIGKPICMDHQTASGKRLAFVKVMVEVTVGTVLPSSISVASKGSIFHQAVEYDWKQKGCEVCNTFNHSPGNCPRLHEEPSQPNDKSIGRRVKKQGRRSSTKKGGQEHSRPSPAAKGKHKQAPSPSTLLVVSRNGLHKGAFVSMELRKKKIQGRTSKVGDPSTSKVDSKSGHSSDPQSSLDLNENMYSILCNMEGDSLCSEEDLLKTNELVQQQILSPDHCYTDVPISVEVGARAVAHRDISHYELVGLEC